MIIRYCQAQNRDFALSGQGYRCLHTQDIALDYRLLAFRADCRMVADNHYIECTPPLHSTFSVLIPQAGRLRTKERQPALHSPFLVLIPQAGRLRTRERQPALHSPFPVLIPQAGRLRTKERQPAFRSPLSSRRRATCVPRSVSPLSTLRSPLSALHSPLSTLHSPLSALHSPLSTLHSPLSALHSPLSALHSPYLPMQKREKMLPSTSSLVTSPVMVPRW